MITNGQDRAKSRIAWLMPSIMSGFYWHPVFREFAGSFPETILFTGGWPGFAPGCENSFRVEVVGKTRHFRIGSVPAGADNLLVLPPLGIVPKLIQFDPQVIFSMSFSLWTILVLLLKPWRKWRVIVVYDGSAPGVDVMNSRFRLLLRRVIARNVDALITNSDRGKQYLRKVLNVKDDKILNRPYQVPDAMTLLAAGVSSKVCSNEMRRPIFLFVGRTTYRKGLGILLENCSTLREEGYEKFTLLVAGDGPQRAEFESLAKSRGLEAQVKWTGWVSYGELGHYYRSANVFVFPTLDDVWGMVVLESMLFGKPVLCSKWAGASEMVIDGENGYVFDPYEPERLVQLMKRFIDNPGLTQSMGKRSKEIIAPHTPKAAGKHLADVAARVLNNGQS